MSDISPIIDRCPKLARIYVSNCPNLKTVISSNLKSNINYFFLSDCPEVEKSIEKIISLSPKLKTVRGDFKQELIKKYPHITFEEIPQIVRKN
ncbi:MAG: hypothetical protein IPN89_16105 [Saprospiraceae bacterium]|nr:hypothetical protein [Saprospiraceae bacterium]